MNATHSKAALVAGVTALLAATTACAPVEADERLANVYLVTTATANEFRPTISEDLAEVLKRSARIRDARATVLLPAEGRVLDQGGADLAVLRGQDTEADPGRRAAGFTVKVGEVQAVLDSTCSASTRLDLLTGLTDAAKRSDAATIVVMSSGLQTAGLLDFSRLGWDVDPDHAVDTVEEAGFLPDFAGKEVYFSGLGDATGTQAPLPAPMKSTVVAVWSALCERADAVSCTVLGGAGHEEPTTRVAGMVTVPVPTFELPPLAAGPGETVWNLDSEALFAADSAELLPAAEKALAGAAASISGRGATVSVVGHTWRVGPADGARALSLVRARAVADELMRCGVPAASITGVRGAGYDEPLPASGGRDEAASNRVVTLTVTTS